MKPSFVELQALCPGMDENLARQHLSRLDVRYFQRFPLADVCLHLQGMSRLNPAHPVEVLLRAGEAGKLECTILAFDYPFEFSLLTGIMAGLGFDVISGEIHTYTRLDPSESPRNRPPQLVARRRIVDYFFGQLNSDRPLEVWAGLFRQKLTEIILLLESGQPADLAQAKHKANELVAHRLAILHVDASPVLMPMQITIDNGAGPFTRLRVLSEDTPAFLYALSNALSLKGISIEHIRIMTFQHRIEDTIDFVGAQGGKIEDAAILDQIKLSALLTKQFTHFLGKAPDPFAALARFESMVEDVLKLPESGRWVDLLSNPRILQDLARLLGASDYLWEDMVRLQYETLLPMLKPQVEGQAIVQPITSLGDRLRKALDGARTIEEQRQRLNEFKDREIFLIDLNHILNARTDFQSLSEHLTVLAEAVVSQAAHAVYQHLTERFGIPRTVAALPARYAVLGLGKLGGAALGYASDIELMFVYSDNGFTDGAEVIDNREFFERLARETAGMIQAKREGIFHVDQRLRPFGEDGPLACSLDTFCSYFSSRGQALAYERLALVRLRAVGGDPELGAQIERVRDELVYAAENIQVRELRELREKQLQEKTRPGVFNAKFSPGALVDLEYDVQILQVMRGKDLPDLRTPRIHEALLALRGAGVLQPQEYARLVGAYDFLRRLINGLRMLRGSARDLFLPPADSDEFVHLARRLGYEPRNGLSPEQQLHLEFETHTAAVRAFVEQHFGRDSLPGPAVGNVADVVLSENLPEDLRRRILRKAGFVDQDKAYINLRGLAEDTRSRELVARLAVLACDMLAHKPDPDMALNNWQRFAGAIAEPEKHFERLLAQPMRLDILLNIFAASQFLADTLIRYPEFFEWVTNPENLRGVRRREALDQELRLMTEFYPNESEWLNALRKFRKRELLRIGTRDICLQAPLPEITLDLSVLAEALIRAALDRAWEKMQRLGKYGPQDMSPYFCVLAFGKLGGQELNYSSDVDLLGLCSRTGAFKSSQEEQDPFAHIMEEVRAFLSAYTEEGYVYRVDLRLRPYGQEGQLVHSMDELEAYYAQTADLPEIQALLKLRPIAGNLELGQEFMSRVRKVLSKPRDRKDIIASVEKMRQTALKQLAIRTNETTDVKSGLGGLRDIEFLAQALQMIYAPENPNLLNGNTLQALKSLTEAKILPEDQSAQLQDDYIFLRRVEHYLQILEDRQIHALPENASELTALAKRILGVKADRETFRETLQKRLARVREIYEKNLIKVPGTGKT